MLTNPNIGRSYNADYAAKSPELIYKVNFSTIGTYVVWIHGAGLDTKANSLHVGIDGAENKTSYRIRTNTMNALDWSNTTDNGAVATITVDSAGVHDINLWMGEDGIFVDKIILTTNIDFTPEGISQEESPRVSTPNSDDHFRGKKG